MMHRRHAHRSRIELPNSSKATLNALEAGNAKLVRSRSHNRGIAVDDSNQVNRLTCLLKLAIHPEMVAPEGARSDNSNPQWLFARHYFGATGASTAWRQRP